MTNVEWSYDEESESQELTLLAVKNFLQFSVAKRRRGGESLLLLLVSLRKLGGDVYLYLLSCIYVVDGA